MLRLRATARRFQCVDARKWLDTIIDDPPVPPMLGIVTYFTHSGLDMRSRVCIMGFRHREKGKKK